MHLLESLKIKAKSLKGQLTAVYYASQDSRVPLLPKIIIAIAVGYALSPIDLIPDFIPVIGYLDDLLLLPALLGLAIKLIPKEVMEDAGIRADAEPVSLKKNWIFAALFILVWIVILGALVSSSIKIFAK